MHARRAAQVSRECVLGRGRRRRRGGGRAHESQPRAAARRDDGPRVGVPEVRRVDPIDLLVRRRRAVGRAFGHHAAVRQAQGRRLGRAIRRLRGRDARGVLGGGGRAAGARDRRGRLRQVDLRASLPGHVHPAPAARARPVPHPDDRPGAADQAERPHRRLPRRLPARRLRPLLPSLPLPQAGSIGAAFGIVPRRHGRGAHRAQVAGRGVHHVLPPHERARRDDVAPRRLLASVAVAVHDDAHPAARPHHARVGGEGAAAPRRPPADVLVADGTARPPAPRVEPADPLDGARVHSWRRAQLDRRRDADAQPVAALPLGDVDDHYTTRREDARGAQGAGGAQRRRVHADAARTYELPPPHHLLPLTSLPPLTTYLPTGTCGCSRRLRSRRTASR